MTNTPRSQTANRFANKWLFLSVLLLILAAADVCLGQLTISLDQVWQALVHPAEQGTTHYIIRSFRVPKALMAIAVGAGISLSGLYMQTLFRNPLAGPYVLGVTSGSGLMVALVMMGAAFLPVYGQQLIHHPLGIAVVSMAGSLAVLFAIFAMARQVTDNSSLLLIGLMFSSLCAAFITVLSYFSTADDLQRFTYWGLGNLGQAPPLALALVWLATVLGLLAGIWMAKRMNTLWLGDGYAQSMGVSLGFIRRVLLAATGLMTGVITAFVGPIAFVGMAVPILVKLWFKTPSHLVLIGATALTGACVLVGCDVIAQCPGLSFTLPINAVTSLIGAPFVIVVLYRKKKWLG